MRIFTIGKLLTTLLALTAWSISNAAYNPDDLPLVAMGPADVSGATLSVNDQRILYDGQTVTVIQAINAEGVLETTNTIGVTRISDGDYVAIAGELIEPGVTLATAIIVLAEEYTEGASQTYVRSIISATDDAGFAFSGDSAIDYNGTLHTDELGALSPGDVVEFVGTETENVFVANTGNLAGRTGGASVDSNLTGIRAGGSLRGIRAGGSLRGIRAGGSLR